MRRLLLTLLSCLLTLPLAVLVAPAAHACSCSAPDPQISLGESDLIAEVTVLRESEEHDKRVYDLQVQRAWKGIDDTHMELTTELEGTACGLRLREGESYVLFANDIDGEGWTASSCTATFGASAKDPIVTRADIEAEYGPPMVPTPRASDAESTWDVWPGDDLMPWLILGGSLLVVLVVVSGGVALARGRVRGDG